MFASNDFKNTDSDSDDNKINISKSPPILVSPRKLPMKDSSSSSSSSSDEDPLPITTPYHLERPFVIELDDEGDIEFISKLFDPPRLGEVHLCTTELPPTEPPQWTPSIMDMQLILAVRRVRWKTLESINQRIHSTLDNLLDSVIFNVKDSIPCCLSSLSTKLELIGYGDSQIIFTALCSSKSQTPQNKPTSGVIITPMSYLPGHRIERGLGYINLHLVRESFTLRDELGIEGFATDFMLDVLSMLRAQVAAVGGNALLSFSIDLFHLKANHSKDQGYCLVSLSGDAVRYVSSNNS
jgi:hypothetical protein